MSNTNAEYDLIVDSGPAKLRMHREKIDQIAEAMGFNPAVALQMEKCLGIDRKIAKKVVAGNLVSTLTARKIFEKLNQCDTNLEREQKKRAILNKLGIQSALDLVNEFSGQIAKRDEERQLLESLVFDHVGGSLESSPGSQVAIGHLPPPRKHFVGRKEELTLLDEAWQSANTNIVEFVAFGGVGKSALVAEWLNRMQTDGWRDAARVFGHSFYIQGSREDAQASADSFLDRALRFFDDPEPTEGSPWDKGERLAQLVRQQPTLLILDGVEPL